MIYKLLKVFLSFLVKRYVLVAVTLLIGLFFGFLVERLYFFIDNFINITEEDLEAMITSLNGIGGTLVAFGVVLEERGTLVSMSNYKEKSFDPYINEISHHNGLGLLIIGLFIEIITLILDIPNEIIDSKGIEVYLFGLSLVLIVISLLVKADLIKDIIKTYFIKTTISHEEK